MAAYCGDTFRSTWKTSKGNDINSVNFYNYYKGKFYELIPEEIYQEIGDFFQDDVDSIEFKGKEEIGNLNVDLFISKLLESLYSNGSVGIILDPGEGSYHFFILTFLQGNTYIIDSYVGIREESRRLFDMSMFKRYISTSNHALYNKLFLVDEELEMPFVDIMIGILT